MRSTKPSTSPESALRALRKEVQLSQAKLARAVGIDAKTISLLELGKVRTMTPRVATLLSDFFSEALGRDVLEGDLGYKLTWDPANPKKRRKQ